MKAMRYFSWPLFAVRLALVFFIWPFVLLSAIVIGAYDSRKKSERAVKEVFESVKNYSWALILFLLGGWKAFP